MSTLPPTELKMVDLIERKRDGHALSEEGIRRFIDGVVDDSVDDGQAAALLMAIYFQGMESLELSVLCDAMLHSGRTLKLDDLPSTWARKGRGFKVDKHSTGGVGDKVSLILAPMIASCGLYVPMISGRGLGHTGGTLDKLESISGLRVELSAAEFERCISYAGFAIASQTADLVPADRRLYALRDVTGTVPSIPLIAASIMSKKLAEGLDALVLDVKVGSGAFMKSPEQGRELAKILVDIGAKMGCQTRALVTDMSQPLGRAVGHSNEIAESIRMLRGESSPADLVEVCFALGSEMLQMGGVASDAAEAKALLAKSLQDGSALSRFERFIEAQGGDPRVIHDLSLLPQAPIRRAITAKHAGFVSEMDCAAVGRACRALGGGRTQQGDLIDHGVGVEVLVSIGDWVEAGQELFSMNQRGHAEDEQAALLLKNAVNFSETSRKPTLIQARFVSEIS